MSNLSLPFDEQPDTVESRIDARDREGRMRAVDPRFNVALEASAGTGKTRVLVDRYVNLLREGVDPSNILAITFTRKAAAEMRERIVASLRAAAARGEFAATRWRELRDRTADIAISTIDAFCLSLLREFPLEADLDPGFSLADDTEVPRLIDESLDRALRICRGVAREDEHVALVFAQLGDRRARAGLTALLHRRLVAPAVLSRYLARGPRDLAVATAARAGAGALRGLFAAMPGGFDQFVATGPPEPSFALLVRQVRAVLPDDADAEVDPIAVHVALTRARDHFLTQDGQPRARMIYARAQFARPADFQAHKGLVIGHGSAFLEVWNRYRRDLNVLVSRGVFRMYRIAESEYRRTLETHAVLDFSDVLLRALELLRQMEEFSQSRYRLESRYHHVLVDEFQDTSRAQWELVSLLVQAWGAGAGLAHTGPLPPSIFIVGDRKQSIYSFRDADVSVLHEASRHLETLRPDGDVRRSISRSFRSTPALLAFVNDVCGEMPKALSRTDAFRYDEQDRFPVGETSAAPAGPLGVVAAETPDACARMVAAEVERLLATAATVRDRETGVPRPVRPGDVAILFRTRESHREFELALDERGIPAYVYKGLGFFDADEIKDVIALLWHLAEPLSDLRAAAFLRSRIVALSDDGLRALAPYLADALMAPTLPASAAVLDERDRARLVAARDATRLWRQLVDRLPPAELLDRALTDAGYFARMRGVRFPQARENLKKIRALIRRIQNRGYATLGRVVAHLERLAVGDEANAVIDALDSVNLMTVHAAKGLEFPVVFLVNLSRGTGNRRHPIRVAVDPSGATASVAVGDFRSDADEDDAEREREETKRLLYVAMTRARDRLYLGAVVKEGRMQPGRGSLGEVLPASLLAIFSTAVISGVSTATWQSHVFAVCAAPEGAEVAGSSRPSTSAGDGDFAAVVDDGIRRRSVADAIGETTSSASLRGGSSSDARLGTLVHRLLQRFGFEGAVGLEDAARLVRPADEVDVDEMPQLLADSVRLYQAACARADIRDIYAGGTVLHEVPFSLAHDGAVLRGTIDCVVRTPEGVTVLEFKTGRRRPSHVQQVELYRIAVQAAFPETPVDARLIYLGEAGA